LAFSLVGHTFIEVRILRFSTPGAGSTISVILTPCRWRWTAVTAWTWFAEPDTHQAITRTNAGAARIGIALATARCTTIIDGAALIPSLAVGVFIADLVIPVSAEIRRDVHAFTILAGGPWRTFHASAGVRWSVTVSKRNRSLRRIADRSVTRPAFRMV
jgi:hypothetical protein